MCQPAEHAPAGALRLIAGLVGTRRPERHAALNRPVRCSLITLQLPLRGQGHEISPQGGEHSSFAQLPADQHLRHAAM
jgi:hypothetical protein